MTNIANEGGERGKIIVIVSAPWRMNLVNGVFQLFPSPKGRYALL